jgi:uncharacterized protein involved in exopolysaccharide biosynthesis
MDEGRDSDELLADLRHRVRARPVAQSSGIELRVLSTSATNAAALANRIASEFIDLNQLLRQRQTLNLLFFLRSQASGLQADLAKLEWDRRELAAKAGLLGRLTGGRDDYGLRLESARAAAATAGSRAQSAKVVVVELDRHLASGGTLLTFPPIAASGQIKELELDLARAESTLAGKLMQTTADHPETVAQQAKVDSLRQTIARLAQNEAEVLRNTARLADAEVRAQWERVREAAEAEASNTDRSFMASIPEILDRKSEATKALFDKVLTRMKYIELVQRDKASPLWIIDEAAVPTRPVYPLRRLALLGFGGGAMLLLVGLLLVREQTPAEVVPV